MRKISLAIAATVALTAGQVQAKQPERPITDNDPDVMDVAKTPTTDLNITKEEIPSTLIKAVEKPYDLTGLGQCKALIVAVEDLDTILGPDFDLPQEARERISPGRVAKWVVSSFIPFRGLIRELSGANAQERALQAAIQAGISRRGFLKGIGHARGCKHPASPATPEVIETYLAKAREAENDDAKDKKKEANEERTKSGVRIVSEPVVQPTR